MRVSKGFSLLRTLIQTQRRGVSEFAKAYGYRMKNTVFPQPKASIFALVFHYSLAGFLIWDVIQDRKKHNQVFIEHYEEGKEYLKKLPAFNKFWPLYYPEIDRFLGKPIGVIDQPEGWTVEEIEQMTKMHGFDEEKVRRYGGKEFIFGAK